MTEANGLTRQQLRWTSSFLSLPDLAPAAKGAPNAGAASHQHRAPHAGGVPSTGPAAPPIGAPATDLPAGAARVTPPPARQGNTGPQGIHPAGRTSRGRVDAADLFDPSARSSVQDGINDGIIPPRPPHVRPPAHPRPSVFAGQPTAPRQGDLERLYDGLMDATGAQAVPRENQEPQGSSPADNVEPSRHNNDDPTGPAGISHPIGDPNHPGVALGVLSNLGSASADEVPEVAPHDDSHDPPEVTGGVTFTIRTK